ncbi:hypothetical protein AOQ84DRAFT_279255 [Glonium stellatum]|uniref:Uncharacterized protein n=1 Tax=Glonium stellatum TaxID=574774 RepID=A0A8E2FF84_9PEZI|nr:hypothetical protein AOQ84DRAFT_279255 [Glonium stellatum]
MSAFTRPRNLAIAAGTIGALYMVVPIGKIRTSEVDNIEGRWTAGGAHPTHTPGTSTKRGIILLISYSSLGDPHSVENDEQNPSGISTAHFKEHVSDQKVDPTPAGKSWNKMQYGNEKGK